MSPVDDNKGSGAWPPPARFDLGQGAPLPRYQNPKGFLNIWLIVIEMINLIYFFVFDEEEKPMYRY